MKSHEAFVQLHLLAGGSSYLAGVIGSVMESMKTTKTIRISQRMKADTNQVKGTLKSMKTNGVMMDFFSSSGQITAW